MPQRGDKRALLETVARNAGQSLALHKTRRASDLTTRSRALHEIQEALGLDDAPLRIECYDMSNLQGTHVVASMVVFEDGLARKSEYRRFSIKGLDGTDDVAAIHEVITRRFRRYLEERERDRRARHAGRPRGRRATQLGRHRPARPQRRKFAYPPNLRGDRRRPGPGRGGRAGPGRARHRRRGRLRAGQAAGGSLAARRGRTRYPARTSEGLYLLQRVRDEAHRFAITYHRAKRSKALTASELDDVPGPGPGPAGDAAAALRLGAQLAAASVEEIARLPGIGPSCGAGGRRGTAPGRCRPGQT